MGAEILVETVAGGGVTSQATPSPAESDYRSLHDALSSSERGRQFLAEFSRRNRHADTQMLLAAVGRLEILLRADGTALERLRDELRMLLIAIRLVRPEIETAAPPAKAEKLSGLLDMFERRLDAMAERKTGDVVPAGEEPFPSPAMLKVVPISDEPELPMPSPAAAPLPPITLVKPSVAMPEVTFVANAPLGPTVVDHATIEKAAAEKTAPPVAKAALPPVDPLAPILALSEFEKIALFT
jgi:hypothetical protein